MDSYTVRAPIFVIFTALMQFMHICCNSRTFFVVHGMSRFTRFGSQKKMNLGLRAKKTEFPALLLDLMPIPSIQVQLQIISNKWVMNSICCTPSFGFVHYGILKATFNRIKHLLFAQQNVLFGQKVLGHHGIKNAINRPTLVQMQII